MKQKQNKLKKEIETKNKILKIASKQKKNPLKKNSKRISKK
jgi:hypothetical protein